MEEECSVFKLQRFAESTKQTHRVQLDAYRHFCYEFGLKESSDMHHICLYITFLARRLSFSSIRQYISALHTFFLLEGKTGIDYENIEYQTCLAGIRRQLGDKVFQALPLLPADMVKMFDGMSLTVDNVVIRAALLLSFRVLLRQEHITSEVRALRRADFEFFQWGMTVKLKGGKTVQYEQRSLLIPVTSLDCKKLCAVHWVAAHFEAVPADRSDIAFRVVEGNYSVPLSYQSYLFGIRRLASAAGLDSSLFSTHSARRGGATYLQHCGLSLDQIKEKGEWCSNAVHKYLSTSFKDRIGLDVKIASFLNIMD